MCGGARNLLLVERRKEGERKEGRREEREGGREKGLQRDPDLFTFHQTDWRVRLDE